ncbi:MAG: beta-ketoacyl synthase N-terminal-like domain-containing protein [Chloroflexota bacterium]
MRSVSIVGFGQVPVQKHYSCSLQELAAKAIKMAMEMASVSSVDSLFAGNMLGDELQDQKHLAALIADETGLRGVEALQVRAATATGAAALRMAYFAVASGEADLAVAVGVEKMSDGNATPALAKALDAEKEVKNNQNLISVNADLMARYMKKYHLPANGLANFSVNAHNNAITNPNAIFRKNISAEDVINSRIIYDPIRLLDCSPICDGAAAVILAPESEAKAFSEQPVKILSSSVATDRFRISDRDDPLVLRAAQLSVQKAFQHANVNRREISFFEVHDAFSIMACLLLEAVGFAERGQGWRLAKDGEIGLDGTIPISTMGGLKGRGHPIGATAIYQTCEIIMQLTHQAKENQVKNPEIALLQSVGGAATTVISHIFSI